MNIHEMGRLRIQPLRQTPDRGGFGGSQHDSEVRALVAKGLTPYEASRVIHTADKFATSQEVREGQATLRRLRFTRWLVEHGMLDEWSA